MGEKLGVGAYAESLGNCCADAPEHVQAPTSTTSAATFARTERRFNPGAGFQLIDIVHALAAPAKPAATIPAPTQPQISISFENASFAG
ncbi:hypothetical protein [Bradyrhizobium elkanii]|uniref:hypothetical protein n=1 Tax=Bradyrhizobium elkanii TaxID=29448 RepID=UPI00209CD68D|nr:hypothetical protein [Bradyrhizobium elkanii]MCP1974193.1 hypothetical protein [Bradyrhizobium elkanii]MCS3521314.1 hypothetical protein [Bradyrhizobium elkanii]MCS4068969.1 hypothetical protein [Bradyrhizobium elkanii]MCS4084503.1 hypothetical protein [Bradyrhizobium elkanii]MCS4104301.1 hypothetical protein [Bradyrhizobium elkanii]